MSFNLEDSIDSIFTIPIVIVKHTQDHDVHSKDVVIVLKFHNGNDLFKKT